MEVGNNLHVHGALTLNLLRVTKANPRDSKTLLIYQIRIKRVLISPSMVYWFKSAPKNMKVVSACIVEYVQSSAELLD